MVVAGAHALACVGVVVDGRQVVKKERARARTDSGGRTEGAVVSQVVYGSDDVCVVEIAMQVGAGMQAGRRARGSGLLLLDSRLPDCWTNSGRVLMRRPRVSSRAGGAVLRCLATMQSVAG